MRWLALLLAVACRPTSDSRPGLRDEARSILSAHCGACHEAHRPTAAPGALAVFDLDEPEWAARMSDGQLHGAHWRLGQPIPPDGREGTVDASERARFARYVDAELAARRRVTGCPPDELLEAVHAVAFRLEHESLAAGRAELARAAPLIKGPLDEKTRALLARLAFAAANGGDPTEITEQVRAELADWSCLTADRHKLFHERLP